MNIQTINRHKRRPEALGLYPLASDHYPPPLTKRQRQPEFPAHQQFTQTKKFFLTALEFDLDYEIEGELLSYIDHYFEAAATAIGYDDRKLFQYETRWLNSVLRNHFQVSGPPSVYRRLMQSVAIHVNIELRNKLIGWIQGTNNASKSYSPVPNANQDLKSWRHQLLKHLLKLDRGYSLELLQQIQDKGYELNVIFEEILIPVLNRIGELWEYHKISVTQEHFASASIRDAISMLSAPQDEPSNPNLTVAISAVEGEEHELGLSMLAAGCKSNGWKTINMGANTPCKDLLNALAYMKPDVLALSVSLTEYVPRLEQLIKSIHYRSDITNPRIIVGGLPFNISTNLSSKIGADYTAQSVTDALRWINKSTD
ncbi:MAG: cobalamin B12-binding domain-containing protein [Bacteroidota bacterium]